MSRVEFVPATQELAERYFGGTPSYGFRGYAFLLDGDVVGLGGLFWYEGWPIVFSQIKDSMRAKRKDCARAVRLLMNFLDDLGFPVYALQDPDEPTSAGLLAKLGFVRTGIEIEHGELLMRRR